METRPIGQLQVSVVGLGCNNFGWRLDQGDSTAVIGAALESGITFFDTADVYGDGESETYLGRALHAHRDEVVIATKFGLPMNGGPRTAKPEYVHSACQASLKRLGIDHIDLFQLHRPDPETPVEDTIGALQELAAQGKIREFGCSGFSANEIRSATAVRQPDGQGFVSVQNAYSLLAREADLDVIPECLEQGIAFIPYAPLFNGMLSGKYTRAGELPEGARLTKGGEDQRRAALTDQHFTVVEGLTTFAKSRGHSVLELAFARLLAQPAIPSVIAGASTRAQVVANVAAGEWRLSAREVAATDEITRAT